MITSARGTILLLLLVILSCEKNTENAAPGKDPLIGSWFGPQQDDSTVTYQRAAELAVNEYGFDFHGDGTFTERKNAGWCGTPPISYADFEGTWTRNDSMVQITVGYWGGRAEYTWKILSLNETSLTILVIEQDYLREE